MDGRIESIQGMTRLFSAIGPPDVLVEWLSEHPEWNSVYEALQRDIERVERRRWRRKASEKVRVDVGDAESYLVDISRGGICLL